MDLVQKAWQKNPVEKSADFTAALHGVYVITGTLTVTDPTPDQGHEYICFVRNGVATIGGTSYIAGQVIWRSYHSGAWSNTVEASLGTAQTWSAAQTFGAGLTVSSGTTAMQAATCTSLNVGAASSFAGLMTITGSSGGVGISLTNGGGTGFTLSAGSASFAFTQVASNDTIIGTTTAHGVLIKAGGNYALYFGVTGTAYLYGQTTVAATTASTSTTTGALTVAGGVGIAKGIYAGESIRSVGPTSGVGYDTGAGGSVTQITSRTTGVTLDKVCGQITLVSAAGSATWQSFTVTNSAVATTDVVRVCQDSGTDKYMTHVTAVGAGSFEITFATTGGTTTEQPVFNFAVMKAVAA